MRNHLVNNNGKSDNLVKTAHGCLIGDIAYADHFLKIQGSKAVSKVLIAVTQWHYGVKAGAVAN